MCRRRHFGGQPPARNSARGSGTQFSLVSVLCPAASHCCMGMGAAGPPASVSTVCSRCANRCSLAAACACLCCRTAAQCCLWCCSSVSTAGGSLLPPASASAEAAAEAGRAGCWGGCCCSVAAAASECGGSGGSLDAGAGCTWGRVDASIGTDYLDARRRGVYSAAQCHANSWEQSNGQAGRKAGSQPASQRGRRLAHLLCLCQFRVVLHPLAAQAVQRYLILLLYTRRRQAHTAVVDGGNGSWVRRRRCCWCRRRQRGGSQPGGGDGSGQRQGGGHRCRRAAAADSMGVPAGMVIILMCGGHADAGQSTAGSSGAVSGGGGGGGKVRTWRGGSLAPRCGRLPPMPAALRVPCPPALREWTLEQQQGWGR